MGIRKIIQPGSDPPPPQVLGAMRAASAPGAIQLNLAPGAANLAGDTPMLIAATSRPSPYASRGQLAQERLELRGDPREKEPGRQLGLP